jgi:oxygen-independent coproporphyrinogen-3 oxidase
LLLKNRPVKQIHFGGGIPTYLSDEQLVYLIEKLGFNRISIGIQGFDPKVQQAVNRIQPEAMSRKVIEQSRELGFNSVSVDLIYGLPHQTPTSFAQTIERIIVSPQNRRETVTPKRQPGDKY